MTRPVPKCKCDLAILINTVQAAVPGEARTWLDREAGLGLGRLRMCLTVPRLPAILLTSLTVRTPGF